MDKDGFSGLEFCDGVCEEGGQLTALAPAERPTIERGLTVRVGDGELGEILAGLGALIDLLRALGGRLLLPRARFLADGDQDVRDVVFVAFRGRLPLLVEELIDLARSDAMC